MTIAVIRIRGQVKLKNEVAETLSRLRLRRKLACVLIDENDAVRMGMLKKVEQYVAYGKVDDRMVEELKAKRGKKDVNGKLKQYFRLHPPIGGFKKSTKQSVGRNGALGKHEDIWKLLGRML